MFSSPRCLPVGLLETTIFGLAWVGVEGLAVARDVKVEWPGAAVVVLDTDVGLWPLGATVGVLEVRVGTWEMRGVLGGVVWRKV